MGNTYVITGHEKFIIYGASSLGEKILNGLCQNDLSLKLFIDRRAKREGEFSVLGGPKNIPDTFCGLPVCHPAQVSHIDKNDIVIIAVTNYFEHPIIADMLYKLGYRKIIGRTTEWNINDDIYELILDEKSPVGYKLSLYEPMNRKDELINIATPIEEEGQYMVYMPVELLFYYDNDGNYKSLYMENELLPYYHFLEGRNSADFLSVLDRMQRKNVDINRWMEVNHVRYFQLSSKWQKGDFWKTLPAVESGERGTFFVKEDIEKFLFCLAKSYSRIPCKISRIDLEMWDKPEDVRQLYRIMEEQKISTAYTPIPYPAFYYFQAQRESCGHTRLMRICRYFVEKGITIDGKNILDAGSYLGYFAQHMYRMGANVTAVEFDWRNYELQCEISKLVGCNDIEIQNIGIQDMEESKNFDITILLTVLYWHFDTEMGIRLMKKVDKLTKGILVWESGDEPDREKNWIFSHSSFNRYEKIADTFGTQKLREMGVFWRN